MSVAEDAWAHARKLAAEYRRQSENMPVAGDFHGSNDRQVTITPEQLSWHVASHRSFVELIQFRLARPACPIRAALVAAAISGGTLADAWNCLRGIGMVIPSPKAGNLYTPDGPHLAYTFGLGGQRKYLFLAQQLILDSALPAQGEIMYFNTIYYGPPGTGKTYIVTEKAAAICDKERNDYEELVAQGRIAFVTFHQSYSYEDFVEGIRPIVNNDEDAVKYEIRKGIFRLMCDRADDEPEKNYVLIIDEINRANISKVFGELITLLEPDKRLGADNEIKVRLPYSGDEFGIPSNLYLIGTMNTADRSIALLDTALRRRFEFEEMMPKPTDLPIKVVNGEDGKNPIELVTMLETLNKHVEYLYDRDHTIGHAFFWNVETLDDLRTIFRHKVIPLLQEYFYEDWKKIGQVLNDAGDGSAFLRVVDLPPPRLAAQDNGYGETRKLYSVNEQFTADAFRNIYSD